MTTAIQNNSTSLTSRLSSKGYWVAQAAEQLSKGNYSQVVRLSQENLTDESNLLSGHLIYAIALYRTGQLEGATEQFYKVLSYDPENIVALKYLGDIQFSSSDEFSSFANYSRILEIDPATEGLSSKLEKPSGTITRTVKLIRKSETDSQQLKEQLKTIPFFTETIGDLYLSQGHNRLAATVYSQLLKKNNNPRIAEKLATAEGTNSQKE